MFFQRESRRGWLRIMVGDEPRVQEARRAHLDFLASQARLKNAEDSEQIVLDLRRNTTGMPTDAKADLETLLLAWVWLNKGIGYAQGMDMLAIVLRSHFVESNSPNPNHDTLASLGFVCRVNAAFIPLHGSDPTPLHRATLFASEVWLEVTCMNPTVGQHVTQILDLLEIFAVKHLGVCFANLFNDKTILIVWDYLFKDGESTTRSKALAIAQRRSRHITSACILEHRKLWILGRDTAQNFEIWQSVLRLADERTARHIVQVSTHLETLETMGGEAR